MAFRKVKKCHFIVNSKETLHAAVTEIFKAAKKSRSRMKLITFFEAPKLECAHDLLCGWPSGQIHVLMVSVSGLSLSPVENNQQESHLSENMIGQTK